MPAALGSTISYEMLIWEMRWSRSLPQSTQIWQQRWQPNSHSNSTMVLLRLSLSETSTEVAARNSTELWSTREVLQAFLQQVFGSSYQVFRYSRVGLIRTRRIAFCNPFCIKAMRKKSCWIGLLDFACELKTLFLHWPWANACSAHIRHSITISLNLGRIREVPQRPSGQCH